MFFLRVQPVPYPLSPMEDPKSLFQNLILDSILLDRLPQYINNLYFRNFLHDVQIILWMKIFQ